MNERLPSRIAHGPGARRRVLLLSYAFPPLVNAQAIRWLMLARQLVARRTTVDVLTLDLPPYYQDLLDEIPAGVRVHRVSPGPLERLAFGAKAKLGTENDWVAARRRPGAVGLGRRVYNLARRAANAALVTDVCTEWFPFAAPRALALAREGRFDVVVSSFEPGVNHLLGWLLKRRTGMPWLADFGDPWINQNTPAWRRGIDVAIERRLLANIDAASVTTEDLAAIYETQYPHLSPVHVVPQGFDPDLFAAVEAERPSDSGALNLVYTGTLYPELRSPSAVFSALRLLRRKGMNVRLTVAGRVPLSVVDETSGGGELDGVVRFLGVVAHKRALALQKGADVLLHLDNRGADLQMPGKLYEYVGARRPILVIRHGQPNASAAARCVRTIGCGRDAPDEPHAIAEALEAFSAVSRNLRECESVPDAAEQYSYARSADLLCTAIEQAISRSAARPVRTAVLDTDA